MDHNFQVNINSVSKFADDIKKEADTLNAILDYLTLITRDMETFFDTPTAQVMNEALLRYLRNAKTPCDTLSDLSGKIQLFNKNYTNIYDTTKLSVGDKV